MIGRHTVGEFDGGKKIAMAADLAKGAVERFNGVGGVNDLPDFGGKVASRPTKRGRAATHRVKIDRLATNRPRNQTPHSKVSHELTHFPL